MNDPKTISATVCLQKWLPVLGQLSYMSFALASLVEGLLFSFHLMGRDMIDTSLHTLLVYTCYACALITLLELHFRYQVLPSLARRFCTLLQGSWFIQTGFILYNPFKSTPWNSEGSVHDMFNKSTPLDLGSHTHVILNKSTSLDLFFVFRQKYCRIYLRYLTCSMESDLGYFFKSL